MSQLNKKVLFRSEASKVYYFWCEDNHNNKVLCVDSNNPARIVGHYYPKPPNVDFPAICELKKKWFFVGTNKYTVLWSKKW